MTEPLISIKVDGTGRVFSPGDDLAGEFQVDAIDPWDIQAVELSVLWYTEGKGDEDIGVHHFQRRMADRDRRGQLHLLSQFRTILPASPLSYDGFHVKIRWCVRVRLFLKRGREVMAEQRFQLGNVPTARAVVDNGPIEQAQSQQQPGEGLSA